MADQRSGGIAWTQKTWNPIRGCSRVSEGCRFCYAETFAARFNGPGEPYEGLVTRTSNGPRWTGVVREVPEHLHDPFKWRKPQMVFVNSMSDLFHESLSDEAILRVFDVMRQADHHVFQILTKRPERMRDFCQRVRFEGMRESRIWLADTADGPGYRLMGGNGCSGMPWVWLGVSVEDQAAADKRIPLLLQTPAAVRWISAEPLLGPVDLSHYFFKDRHGNYPFPYLEEKHRTKWVDLLDWIVVGGESGPGSRPFNTLWAQQIIRQCREAGVAVFVKQLGAKPEWGPDGARYELRDRKGGDMSEWPEDLRIREYPRVAAASGSTEERA